MNIQSKNKQTKPCTLKKLKTAQTFSNKFSWGRLVNGIGATNVPGTMTPAPTFVAGGRRSTQHADQFNPTQELINTS